LPWYCGNIVAPDVDAVWGVPLAEEDDEQAATADQKRFLHH